MPIYPTLLTVDLPAFISSAVSFGAQQNHLGFIDSSGLLRFVAPPSRNFSMLTQMGAILATC